jgi:hypothetical protein
METIAPHPYRSALENRDARALLEALHPAVVFHSPAFEEPIRGRGNVVELFAILAAVLEDPEITDELAGEGTRAVVFRASVEGQRIDGVDYLKLDEAGRVRRITVMMRPLASLEALAERMRDTVARLSRTAAP